MDRIADRERSTVVDTLYQAILADDQATLRTHTPQCELRSIRYRGRSLLAWACFHGRMSITLWLLGQGADPSAVDTGGWSVLKQAVHRGDATLVRALIEAGADPHQGRLLWAAWLEGHADVYRALVAQGVRDLSIPAADHRYLLQGKHTAQAGRPLTNPPVPLYAPLTRFSYIRAAIRLVMESMKPRHLLIHIRRWHAHRSLGRRAVRGT